MADIDDLLPIRNLFSLGSFQQVINKCSSGQQTLAIRALLYRAYVAQKRYNLVLAEISESDPSVELRAIRLLARYFLGHSVIEEIKAVGAEGYASPMVAIVVATVWMNENELELAFQAVSPHSKDLDCVALTIQIHLILNRVDLAKKELTQLKTWADDATLAQIVEAWISITLGGEQKYQEAFYVFEELGSSTAATSKLLVGQAVCRMHAKNYAAAETLLQDALNKSNNDQEALVNLIVLGNLSGKPELVSTYTSQLKDVAPKHPFLLEQELKESLFDRCAQRFTVQI
ncbi:hypothetical protein HK098_001540 [Nowakowskiella sp. JEL0407]|nr:hypothetical protein HK098_001540 [Nowakowskiella sp. JEL0407]